MIEKEKRNLERIAVLKEELEIARKKEELLLNQLSETREKSDKILQLISEKQDKINEFTQSIEKHEKNIIFKKKHHFLNRMSGILFVFGFPTYSVTNSTNEIKKAKQEIKLLEEEKKELFKKWTDLENSTKAIHEENLEVIKKMNTLQEEIEKTMSETIVLPTEEVKMEEELIQKRELIIKK